MSSRNRYLSPEQRQSALCLWQALQLAQQWFTAGKSIQHIEVAMQEHLLSHGADRVDYARVVDRSTLESPPLDESGRLASQDSALVALIAAHVGTTRLIDNLLLEPQLAQHAVLHTS